MRLNSFRVSFSIIQMEVAPLCGIEGIIMLYCCYLPVSRKPWSEEELWRLQEGVRQFIGESRSSLKSFQYLPWSKVSTHVVTRTWLQCRMKWSVSILHLSWSFGCEVSLSTMHSKLCVLIKPTDREQL